MTTHRVVITGLGVVAPNGTGLDAFLDSLKLGRSGIRSIPALATLNFSCQVGGVPQVSESLKQEIFSGSALLAMNESMVYAGLAGLECWKNSGMPAPRSESPADWETGAIIGTGIGGADTLGEVVVPRVNEGKVRRLGSSMVEQTMASSVSAWLGGALGLGGQVTTNSSACTTGTEAVVQAFQAIREGRATRMLAGGAEGSSRYIWGGFEAMRVLARGHNENPELASRPMSASASGFVPAAGAGVLMLERLDSALTRRARIYGEILGGHVNCGGQRSGGSITAPNSEGVIRCIRQAILQSGIEPKEIDLINGHLTATMADPLEVQNWLKALECKPKDFPWIQSTKSLIGHALGAAGGIELVASALQLFHGFMHPSRNCEDLHPELQTIRNSIVQERRDMGPRVLAKSSFGFGDVNGCLILKKWETSHN